MLPEIKDSRAYKALGNTELFKYFSHTSLADSIEALTRALDSLALKEMTNDQKYEKLISVMAASMPSDNARNIWVLLGQISQLSFTQDSSIAPNCTGYLHNVYMYQEISNLRDKDIGFKNMIAVGNILCKYKICPTVHVWISPTSTNDDVTNRNNIATLFKAIATLYKHKESNMTQHATISLPNYERLQNHLDSMGLKRFLDAFTVKISREATELSRKRNMDEASFPIGGATYHSESI